MRFLIKVLATLAGFIFTLGGPSKGSAQELRSATLGTAVIAREDRNLITNPSRYDKERNRLLTVQANPADATKDTKPTKKTKSPSKRQQ
jgi:hypothetical protein